MRDPFEVRGWRQKPLRERLLPWPVYAVMTVVSLVLGVYLLAFDDAPGRLPVGSLFFVMVPVLAYYAFLSRRIRRPYPVVPRPRG